LNKKNRGWEVSWKVQWQDGKDTVVFKLVHFVGCIVSYISVRAFTK